MDRYCSHLSKVRHLSALSKITNKSEHSALAFEEGYTPSKSPVTYLMYSQVRACLQVAELLLGAGALDSVKDSEGNTPKDLAPALGCWQ